MRGQFRRQRCQGDLTLVPRKNDPAVKDAVPALERLAGEDPEGDVRQAATETLKKIRAPAAP